MDVVANLFSLVAEDAVGSACDAAPHEVGEEAVELGCGVRWAGDASAAKAGGPHAEVTAVFLHHEVGSGLGSAEDAVHAVIEGHAFVDAGAEGVSGVDLPARVELDER